MKRTDRTKILVLGSTGMAGHVAATMLARRPELQVFNIARTVLNEDTIILDARDRKGIDQAIGSIEPNIIINCIGVLIKESEKDPKNAVEINSFLPHSLVDLCDRHGGRLVHLSTDCVFSGKGGPYKMTDFRDGDSFYDRSKALGEIVNERDLTIRTSIVGPELKSGGTGLFHWFMSQHGTVKGYSDSFWSGVMTTDLALFLEDICLGLETSKGLVHYSVPGGISKYELLRLFQSEFNLPIEVEKFENGRIDKRLIPSQTLSHQPLDYISQVIQLKKWMTEHRNLYHNYPLR